MSFTCYLCKGNTEQWFNNNLCGQCNRIAKYMILYSPSEIYKILDQVLLVKTERIKQKTDNIKN